jgi:hypothetical protein
VKRRGADGHGGQIWVSLLSGRDVTHAANRLSRCSTDRDGDAHQELQPRFAPSSGQIKPTANHPPGA